MIKFIATMWINQFAPICTCKINIRWSMKLDVWPGAIASYDMAEQA